MPHKSSGPRRRTAVACDRCRRRKIRCIACEFPNQPCMACQKAHAECHFSVSSWRSSRKRTTPFHCPPHSSSSSSSSSSLSYPTTLSGDPSSISTYPPPLAASAPSKLSSFPPSFVSSAAASPVDTSTSSFPSLSAPSNSSRQMFYPSCNPTKNSSTTLPSYNDPQAPPTSSSFVSSPLVQTSLYMSPPSHPIDPPISPTTVPIKQYASSSSSPPSLSASISSVSSVPGYVDHDPLQPYSYQTHPFSTHLDSSSSPSTPNSNFPNHTFPSSNLSTAKFPQDGYVNKPFHQLPMLSDLSLPNVQQSHSTKQDSSNSFSSSSSSSKNQPLNSFHSTNSQLLGDSDFDYSSYLTDSSDSASPAVQTDEPVSHTLTTSGSDPIGSVDPLSLEIDQFTNLQESVSSNNPLETSFSQFSNCNPSKSTVLPWTIGSPPMQSFAYPDFCGSLDESFQCLDFTNENLWWENLDSEKTTPLKTEKPILSSGSGVMEEMSHFLKNLDD
ncbi:DNA-binding transcription factor, zf-fungal binuclear cluster type [Schizosaccharomyces osmophilus]|uniref:DNA-binding transcription factor, zf-fungal binuclear cluster type n=1 Tax=Schizosaccharomyces osmophilus TaxID=2545709 RepID=A0AAE9WCH4_9SCHI|nr:DNA-binding transcription factor, zf-fungal binuclear cluster type [Schizosaccharomyces osmophilus]WBW73318.1 DNA-binding transcription factor, zf-fungal binuclear cluster type [Schizosaccharomyces osmophilus]